MIKNDRCLLVGSLNIKGHLESADRVYSPNGLSPTLDTCAGGGLEKKIIDMESKERIRKLTEGECYRLMGFEEKDTNACKEVGQPKSTIYHQAGDSIVTTCLVALFGELLGFDYDKEITDYTDKLHKEVEG